MTTVDISVPQSSGNISVNRLYKEGKITTGEESEEDMIDVPALQPGAMMAKVGVSNSMTVNLGNYESVKISVTVELPCYLTREQLNETYNTAKIFVDERLNKEVSEVRDFIANRPK